LVDSCDRDVANGHRSRRHTQLRLALIFITPLALTIATIAHPQQALIGVRERLFDRVFSAAIALLMFWVTSACREIT